MNWQVNSALYSPIDYPVEPLGYSTQYMVTSTVQVQRYHSRGLPTGLLLATDVGLICKNALVDLASCALDQSNIKHRIILVRCQWPLTLFI